MIRTRTIHSLETDKYVLRIHENNFLECIYKPGVTIDVEDCIKIRSEVLKFYTMQKFYVFVEGIEFFTVTRQARELSATKEFSSHLAAVAFYTQNSLLMSLGDMHNKVTKPHVLTKFFRNREDALEWLNDQKQFDR